MFEKTVQLIDTFLEKDLPGYDFIVCKDGKEIFRHRNGYSDIENQVPMNGDERYNIYSCSKVITCVAAMQLWEKGAFSLEDKLSDYMPEFAQMDVRTEHGLAKAQNPIQIKHLFEMTAGFDYCVDGPEILEAKKATDGKCPTREVMKYLAKRPLLFEPGTRWEYSLCHDVLAALVEVVSGVLFSEYVKKHIFEPLGMSYSTFRLPEKEVKDLCPQYRYKDGKRTNCGKYIQDLKLGSEYDSGGAGCISTLNDYIKFLEALREGERLLKRSTIELMQTDRLSDCQKVNYWWKETHGYGLGVRCQKEGGIYSEFGWDGAAGAYAAVDIPNGITMYYAQHMLHSPYDNTRIYKTLIQEIQEAEVLINSATTTVTESGTVLNEDGIFAAEQTKVPVEDEEEIADENGSLWTVVGRVAAGVIAIAIVTIIIVFFEEKNP